jgi:hypothetical protein
VFVSELHRRQDGSRRARLEIVCAPDAPGKCCMCWIVGTGVLAIHALMHTPWSAWPDVMGEIPFYNGQEASA